MVVEMDRNSMVCGTRCGVSDSRIMLQTEADINRRVLAEVAILVDFVVRKDISHAPATKQRPSTTPVGAVDKMDTLRVTAFSQIRANAVATIEEMVGMAHKATTPRISRDSSFPHVGGVANSAITLTSALIRRLSCQVDPVAMGQWRIGAGSVTRPCTCRLTAQLSPHRAARCISHVLQPQQLPLQH